MGAPDIDARISALQTAVADGDAEAIAAQLEAIEQELQAMNPLVRGMTYAHVQSVLGQPAKAAAVLEDLLELMPEAGTIYYQLGCYRRAAAQPEDALQAFVRATELDASLVDAWLERGTLLDAQGQPEQAIEAYRHAILRAPDQIDSWRNLGNALAALACFDQALEAYGTARRLHPDDPTLAFLVASVHQARGALDQANAALPPRLRAELGGVIEVRLPTEGFDLRCRFHATTSQRERYEATARALLRTIVGELAGVEAFPHARGGAFVARHQQVLLVCDPDAIRPQRPHRFFDATRTIAEAAG